MNDASPPLASNEAGARSGFHGIAHATQAAIRWTRRATVREWLAGAVVALSLGVAGRFYLAPASDMMWAGDRTHLMSNGGDATVLPFAYDVIRSAGHQSLRNLLYGSIYNPRIGPPNGSGMWVPWIERWIVVILGGVVPLEAMPTAIVWILMVLAGLSFYAFARVEAWPRLLAFALALAYAFNAYTRARAVVHAGLVAIYCLPLIFVALRWIKRDPKPKRLAVAAALLVFSMWTAHYYLLMLVAISPLFIWFQLREDEVTPEPVQKRARLARLLALTLAAAPAIAFLAWNYLKPLAPGTPRTRTAIPPTDVADLYMRWYAATPVDYVAHDLALGADDLIPLRHLANERILAAGWDGGNVWEHANGIRWSILVPFLLLMVAMCVPVCRRWLRASVRDPNWRKLSYWSVFAALMFWCSLAPQSLRVYDHDIGASAWVHALFPEFRVPSRFGPFFHFGVLALVGTYVAAHWERYFGHAAPRWRRALPCVLPLIMVLDYSPLQPVAIDRTYPPRFDLVSAGAGRCGVGIHFPYSAGAGTAEELEWYRAMQQMRETGCRNLQQPFANEFHKHLYYGIGTPAFNNANQSSSAKRSLIDRFVRFARCARLDWVLFRERVPEQWRSELCRQLKWKRVAPDACSSPRPRRADFADPAPACTSILEGAEP